MADNTINRTLAHVPDAVATKLLEDGKAHVADAARHGLLEEAVKKAVLHSDGIEIPIEGGSIRGKADDVLKQLGERITKLDADKLTLQDLGVTDQAVSKAREVSVVLKEGSWITRGFNNLAEKIHPAGSESKITFKRGATTVVGSVLFLDGLRRIFTKPKSPEQAEGEQIESKSRVGRVVVGVVEGVVGGVTAAAAIRGGRAI